MKRDTLSHNAQADTEKDTTHAHTHTRHDLTIASYTYLHLRLASAFFGFERWLVWLRVYVFPPLRWLRRKEKEEEEENGGRFYRRLSSSGADFAAALSLSIFKESMAFRFWVISFWFTLGLLFPLLFSARALDRMSMERRQYPRVRPFFFGFFLSVTLSVAVSRHDLAML